ncbi:MAG TPA: hypothetical protein VN026_13880 [Bacteroidia bacterium]|jgi:hypothetical protein|nr:hypothetical protein [Bacteroidia bacterium]
MVSKELKYINGHFYDDKTKNRIELKDNIKITVATDEKNFILLEPAGNKPKQILDAKAKKQEVESDKKVKHYKKVFGAGKALYFHIPKEDVWFKAELLEDLYIFLNKKSKKDEGKLYSCACVVTANINNKILFFEEIYGTSLNELYKSTYVHYYGNFGNPACNALDRFLEDYHDENSNLMKYRLFTSKDKKAKGNPD